ncbi:sugar kinase [Pseudaminobacter sp. 19-2017]|uniref:Sugar kinase n=1 Tax=Pseudaminobacter soli (ex Zhang et al. 2022) TaxID=2831468 RepID=A0A942DVJ1_9HYPH|nr:sugar kinase [Pseudaminobacter soli]MBS3647521.1 sugar kinase [Pseudaminobacter soli]
MRGIASVGECMLELSGQSGETWRLGYAGDTFNTMWTMRALTQAAVATDYVSAFGDDPFSHQQIAFFQEHGIGIASSPIIPGARPGLYAITLTGAERSFAYWRSDAAARQLARDPAALARSLDGRQLVYFSGITLAILEASARTVLLNALSESRRSGTRIAFDPNYRPRLWQDTDEARLWVTSALGVADVALPTFPDEAALFGDRTPEETAERMVRAGVAEVAVKNGEEPALIASRGGHHTSPAVRVAAPVDTTGAGDSFNGAYLVARLQGDEPHEAAAKAHRVAAAVIQVRGALAPFETLRSAFGE